MSSLTITEKYFQSSPAKVIDRFKKAAPHVACPLSVGFFGATLAKNIADIRGDTQQAKICDNVADGFGGANFTLSAIRVFPAVIDFFTGKVFWQTNEDNTWKRDEDNNYVRHDLIDIIKNMIEVAARILTPIQWFHGKGVMELGKHAAGFKNATMGLWASYLSLDLMQNVHALYKGEGESYALKKRIGRVVCDILNLIALPFGFGYGMQTTPQLAIVGASLNLISKIASVVNEMLFD